MSTNKSDKFTVIGSLECPWCVKAQELLSAFEKNYEFQVHAFNSKAIKEAKKIYDHPTIPIVLLSDSSGNEFLIGGYSDLEKFITDEENAKN